ncbi:MAG: hypothetical protein WBI36_05510 [Erysipelotrichaceae bacterium]
MKYFLKFASYLTGEAVEQIRVINYSIDEDGLYSGTIEVNGNREYIHEYSC